MLIVLATISSVPSASGHTPSDPAANFGPRLAVGGAAGTEGGDAGSGATPALPIPDPGAALADVTLVKPFAVSTTIPDGRSRLTRYVVRAGDSIYSIAVAHHLSISTVMWANELSGRLIHVGLVLRLPPIDGVVVAVGQDETLESIAARTDGNAAEIASYNGITDAQLVVGQVLIVPGGTGLSIDLGGPVPTPTRPPITRTRTSGSSSCPACALKPLAWPVAGGWRHISQGFGCTGFVAEPTSGSCAHFHGGIDIWAASGTPIVAAASGKVVLAGWTSNGGGNQVCLDDGVGVFTCYHHMSLVAVSVGDRIVRGARIGSVGMTGNATGPHVHFEIWIGPIWAGGYRIDPMPYF